MRSATYDVPRSAVHSPSAVWRQPSFLLVLGCFAVLAASAVSGVGTQTLAPIVLLLIVFSAAHRALFSWHSLVGVIILVVLFVPIKRYSLPANLPFSIELYRLVVAIVLLAWFSSLLIDPSVRLRGTAFDWPLLAIVGWTIASDIANPARVNLLSSYVAKGLTFFLSFVLTYYAVASLIHTREALIGLLKLLFVGMSVVGLSAVVEQRTGFNIFFHLHSVLPFLHFEGGIEVSRFGRLRVLASSQHPIALGAALVLAVPLGVYFIRTQGRRWWLPTCMLILGAMATGSRTAIVMLLVIGIVFLRLKPQETRRIWPLLFPAVVIIHIFSPGALGGLKEAFFPKGGLIAEQSRLAPGENPNLAGGRIRQLRPMLTEAAGHPIFGEGFSTRVTGFDATFTNAPILDNQWLNAILELGYVGGAIWLWLFVRSVRRLTRAARAAEGDGDSWLLTALAASICSYGVGMLTYDAWGFIQVTFIFWLLLGFAAAALGALAPSKASESARRRLPLPA